MHELLKLAATWVPKVNPTDVGVPNSTATIDKGLAGVITLLITGIGSLSIVMIIAGGLMYVISRGDPKMIQRGKDTVLYSVIGLIVAIAAYAIVGLITQL
jgi:hypothetical protein